MSISYRLAHPPARLTPSPPAPRTPARPPFCPPAPAPRPPAAPACPPSVLFYNHCFVGQVLRNIIGTGSRGGRETAVRHARPMCCWEETSRLYHGDMVGILHPHTHHQVMGNLNQYSCTICLQPVSLGQLFTLEILVWASEPKGHNGPRTHAHAQDPGP